VRLTGEFDVATAARMLAGVAETFGREQCRTVEVDCSQVSFIDCAALGQLLRLRSAAETDGRRLVVCDPSPPVRRLVALTGTDHLICPSGARPGPRVGR